MADPQTGGPKSKGQPSGSDGCRNLVNFITPEPLTELEKKCFSYI